MKVQSVNNNQRCFGTKLYTEPSEYVQGYVQKLPENAKKGIEFAKGYLSRHCAKNDELQLFCANDVVGYDAGANYWGLELNPKEQKGFLSTETWGFEVFDNKTPIQVARMIIEGYNDLKILS